MSQSTMPWLEMSKIRMILISKIHQLYIYKYPICPLHDQNDRILFGGSFESC